MGRIVKIALAIAIAGAALAGCRTSWGKRYDYRDETYVLTYSEGTRDAPRGYEVGVFRNGKYTTIEHSPEAPGRLWRDIELLGVEKKLPVTRDEKGERD
ncbi:MAG: hypothetical protein KDJ80_10755 [Nitratireductor sp.]|nr:hypothetical protein [Nitratireductor sp.]